MVKLKTIEWVRLYSQKFSFASKKLLAWSNYRKWATLHPLAWQNLHVFMREVARVTAIILLLLLISLYKKKKKIQPIMSKGLTEEWMQAERINIFKCLTYRIPSQYFCPSDKGNECIRQIWIVKRPLPACICTEEEGFWIFIYWLFSVSLQCIYGVCIHIHFAESPMLQCIESILPILEEPWISGFKQKETSAANNHFGSSWLGFGL